MVQEHSFWLSFFIKFGIKFGDKNIGFNGKFYTFPYFTMFLLKKFIKEIDKNN